MKIGLFTDEKKLCYNTLNYFMSCVENAMRSQGIETERIARLNMSVWDKKFDALVGFNRPEPALQASDGRFALDAFSLPFFNIVVDPPYYHHDSLKCHAQKVHLIFMDNGQVQYCRKYYPGYESVEMGYLIGPVETPVPYRERKVDILFTGGCADFTAIKKDFTDKENGEAIREIFLYLIENGMVNPIKSTEEVLQAYVQRKGIPIEKDDFRLVMSRIGTWAEYYLRGYYREKIMRLLVEAGLNVTVAGLGWERAFTNKPDNLTLLGDVDMLETARLTANAKILLNVMPWFKDGFHDRIPTAMHNGAVCVTDSTSYIDKHFKDGENIVLFRLEELEKLPNICRSILEQPPKAEAIAQAGNQKAQREYTWDKFVNDYIVKWL